MAFFGQSTEICPEANACKNPSSRLEYFEGPSVYYAVMEVPENQRMIVGSW